MPRGIPVILAAVPLLLAVADCGRNDDFRHAAHVTVTKGDCAPCHGADPAAPRRAADADCAACHKQAREPGPSGAGRYGVGKTPARPARTPGYGGVAFAHAPHAAAGIPCAGCHAASKWRGNSFVPPGTEECAACHSAMR